MKKTDPRREQRKGSQSQKTQSKLLTRMGSTTLRELNDKDKRGVPNLSCHHILELDPNHSSADSKTYPALYTARLVSPL